MATGSFTWRWWGSIGTLLLIVGCGDKGPARYDISGTVTFAGNPIPVGRIYFSPDLTRGGDGPQGHADIKDGKYNTAETGRGGPGGATLVRIEGFDGAATANLPDGKLLFHAHEINFDMPREKTTKDFDVPAPAAKDLPKPTSEEP